MLLLLAMQENHLALRKVQRSKFMATFISVLSLILGKMFLILFEAFSGFTWLQFVLGKRRHITSADDGSENFTESELTLTKSEKDAGKALKPRPCRVFYHHKVVKFSRD